MDQQTRLRESIEAMKVLFPDFSLALNQSRFENQAVWRGWVQPIQSEEGLIELLSDIHQVRPVYIMPGGEVRHDPSCDKEHTQYPWMKRLHDLRMSYELEVSYSGGRAHPRAVIQNLSIPPHGSKHLFQDGAICAYAPWQNVWRWHEHTVTDFLGHALVWLIKWTVWCQAKVWIGPEISHQRATLLKTIDRNTECWCGSGKKYKKCHLAKDFNSAAAR